MADDIVTRLQEMLDGPVPMAVTRADARDALAEIERLRAAGDVLAAAHVDDLCDCGRQECVAIRAAHDAWKEARRG